jgi:hypothetical protein
MVLDRHVCFGYKVADVATQVMTRNVMGVPEASGSNAFPDRYSLEGMSIGTIGAIGM